jgi:hypothetical protein
MVNRKEERLPYIEATEIVRLAVTFARLVEEKRRNRRKHLFKLLHNPVPHIHSLMQQLAHVAI